MQNRGIVNLSRQNLRANPVPWAKRDSRTRHDVLIRAEFEPETSQEQSQHRHALQQRELLADALPRAAAEREIGESRTFRRLPRTKAAGIEARWIRKILCAAMRHVLAQIKL